MTDIGRHYIFLALKALPFVLEIRTTLDWVFHPTTLT